MLSFFFYSRFRHLIRVIHWYQTWMCLCRARHTHYVDVVFLDTVAAAAVVAFNPLRIQTAFSSESAVSGFGNSFASLKRLHCDIYGFMPTRFSLSLSFFVNWIQAKDVWPSAVAFPLRFYVFPVFISHFRVCGNATENRSARALGIGAINKT